MNYGMGSVPPQRAKSARWGPRVCERKFGQTRGPHGRLFVRGVEMKPSPKAVAGPPSRARMKYGRISTPATRTCRWGPRIFAATLRAGTNFPHFVVTRR
jgi:hypothetical protein